MRRLSFVLLVVVSLCKLHDVGSVVEPSVDIDAGELLGNGGHRIAQDATSSHLDTRLVRQLQRIIVTIFLPKTLRFHLPDASTKLPGQSNLAPNAYINWAEGNMTTPVKDQGPSTCVSAWVNAAFSLLEIAIAFKTGLSPVPLSRQQALDCMVGEVSHYFQQDAGCQGGYVEDIFLFLSKFTLVEEAVYPYTSGETGTTGQCRRQYLSLTAANATQPLNPVYFVGGRASTKLSDSEPPVNVYVNNTLNAIVQALSSCPLVTYWNFHNVDSKDALNPFDNEFLEYEGGIYNGSGCASDADFNHVMLLVGYETVKGEGYWIFQNSWGTEWGEEGFISVRMDKDGPGVCGMYLFSMAPSMAFSIHVPPGYVFPDDIDNAEPSPSPAPSSSPKPLSRPVIGTGMHSPPSPSKVPPSPSRVPPSPSKAPPSPSKAPPSLSKAPPSPLRAPPSPSNATPIPPRPTPTWLPVPRPRPSPLPHTSPRPKPMPSPSPPVNKTPKPQPFPSSAPPPLGTPPPRALPLSRPYPSPRPIPKARPPPASIPSPDASKPNPALFSPSTRPPPSSITKTTSPAPTPKASFVSQPRPSPMSRNPPQSGPAPPAV